jgi:hypothetical protein
MIEGTAHNLTLRLGHAHISRIFCIRVVVAVQQDHREVSIMIGKLSQTGLVLLVTGLLLATTAGVTSAMTMVAHS